MGSMRSRLAAMGLALACALVQGCGGGGGGGDSAAAEDGAPQTAPVPTGTVEGRALDAADGRPLAGVVVRSAAGTATTDAEGRFRLEAPAGGEAVLRGEREGYGAALAVLQPRSDGVVSGDLWLSREGVAQTVSAAAGGTVAVPGSSAAVVLPAGALVDGQGQAFTGEALVRLTPIDPGTRTEAMPGRYATRDDRLLESFGALRVEISTAAGAALQLAPGQEALVRIPVAGRARYAPATMPLFHLDEATGRWVEEGSARLVGHGATAHYEGTVRHFSVWNVDRVLETVWVTGCVRDAAGAVPMGSRVMASGADYAGQYVAAVDADGRFRLAMRRGGVAVLSMRDGAATAPRHVGPSGVDVDLGDTCLVLQPTEGPPHGLILPPFWQTAYEGRDTGFAVWTLGPDVRIQWQRNGVDIPGATGNGLWLRGVSQADNQAVFRARLTTAAGEAYTQAVPLFVRPAPPPIAAEARRVFHFVSLPTSLLGGVSSWNFERDGSDPIVWADPAAVCARGGLARALLNGQPLAGGELVGLRWDLDIAFSDCDLSSTGSPEERLNGSWREVAAITPVGDDGITAETVTTLDLRDDVSGWQGRGQMRASTEQSPVLYDVRIGTVPGSTVTEGSVSALVLTAALHVRNEYVPSSTPRTLTRGHTEYHSAFDTGEGFYEVDGRLDITGPSRTCSGEVTVRRNGEPFGRYFCEGTEYYVEAGGQVIRLVDLVLDKPRSPVVAGKTARLDGRVRRR